MYVDSCNFNDDYGHKRTRHLLRSSYRENGKVKHITHGNLSSCSEDEISAIKLALKHKGNLDEVSSIESLEIQQGLSIGAVWAMNVIAQRVGITKALGKIRMAVLALWLVIARLIDQGSRLSAVRLARTHAACDVLGIEKSFNEDTLYRVLDWCCENQQRIEQKLFEFRYKEVSPPVVYLYDVTSSYLEGQCNELGAFGYDRDGKKGKKQIVIGLLTDMEGYPLAVEVFRGNKPDQQTVSSQIRKLKERFGAKKITLVGDRGMLKSPQQDALREEDFHFITAITKTQIEALLKGAVFQIELFDEQLSEIETADGIRYILRRNPLRRDEIRANREDMISKAKRLVTEQNRYLFEHKRAKPEVALRKATTYLSKRKLQKFSEVELEARRLSFRVDKVQRAECEKLDGCYVIKTDLTKDDAKAKEIHDRYKDLAQVEQAFRKSKTVLLEQRPVYVQKATRTRGHVFVVMLAYMISHGIGRYWEKIDFTIQEGLNELSSVDSEVIKVGSKEIARIPTPRRTAADLLKAIDVKLPKCVVSLGTKVATKRKLPERRQLSK